MTTPPTVQTPPYKPFRPTTPILPNLKTPYETSCHFTLPTFLHVLKDLTLHPERNSSLILRADPIPLDTQSQVKSADVDDEEFENWVKENGMERVDDIRVRLMPKQPKRDGKLDQRVLFYRSKEVMGHEHDLTGDGRVERGVVVMIPLVKRVEDIPFFHPPVRKLVFYYETQVAERQASVEDQIVDQMNNLSTSGEEETAGPATETPEILGRISISYLPIPASKLTPKSSTEPSSTSTIPGLAVRRTSMPRKRSPLAGPSSESALDEAIAKEDTKVTEARLDRTCLALLERVYKHGFGSMVGYKKRVNHDVGQPNSTVVKREPFQDLYLILKDRHRHLDSRAPRAGSTKIEDVKRHVWKNVFESSLPQSSSSFSPDDCSFLHDDLSEWGSQDVAIAAFLMLLWKDMYPPRSTGDGQEEWDSWGRPENGFIDLGCGNGLLVHILTSEGYAGKGYELRARRTWPLYPPRTQAALVESPLDPPSWFPDSVEEWQSGTWPSKVSCVIEENAFLIGNHADELTPWLPLLSLLPTTPVPHLSLPCCLHKWDSPFMHATYKPPPHPHSPDGNFEQGLEKGQSRYKSYLMWLGWVGVNCGWKWETEPLRIPSTRGWGIVARNRWTVNDAELESCKEWALEQVRGVRERGDFKIRVKEGKEH